MNADLQKKETGKKNGSSWQNYKRRRFSFLVIWLTYVPGVFVLGYPLSRLFHSGIPIYILAGAWMVAFIASANYMELFPCPRCQHGRSFTGDLDVDDERPNLAAPGNGAMDPLPHAGSSWRAVPEQHR